MSDNWFAPDLVDTVPGDFYYVIDCPATKNLLIVERDASHGRVPFPPGPLYISCHYCQEMHEIQSPEVLSLRAQKKPER
jgi:hypothetical protein